METTTLGREVVPTAPKTAKPRATARDNGQKASNQKTVELNFEMPQARSVAIAGTFNNWDAKKNQLQKDGNGWKATLTLAPGRYEYRFVIDGAQWLSDPKARESTRNIYGSTNSILEV
ncbi:MAG TPA: isoamylase early set domain-containing protein [Candidatus Dormibacteraeota bacterium]|nr:isoamylase early set domain-containing protein [Candidatus Dormibacteraeota bacterium]